MTKGAAIVTGGSRGIGRATVLRLMDGGLRVATCGRWNSPDDLLDAVLWVTADVSVTKDAEGLVQIARDALGAITVLVNNAGVQVEKTTQDSRNADFDLVMGVNCRGVFNMCRAVLPGMQDTGGAIVNLGSISANVSDPGMALYNASKAWVHGLTRSIAMDHGPQVRCHAISPGWIMTEMAEDGFALARDPHKAMADALARHPVGRFGQPADIANVVSFLVSDQAAYVSSECFTVDGGMTAASPLNLGMF